MLLFCREWQRSVPKCKTHMQGIVLLIETYCSLMFTLSSHCSCLSSLLSVCDRFQFTQLPQRMINSSEGGWNVLHCKKELPSSTRAMNSKRKRLKVLIWGKILNPSWALRKSNWRTSTMCKTSWCAIWGGGSQVKREGCSSSCLRV